MHSDGKVLTGLLERRRREAAFRELAHIDKLDELVRQATKIAEDGNNAIPVLLAMLDTDDPQLRGGLGQVAVHLERDLVVPALQDVVRSATSSDQARVNALTILDRFLDEPMDESLLANLRNPDMVAQQSLSELQSEMARDRFAVIDYLNQLSGQSPEVTQMILDAAVLMPPAPHLVTLLRMVAQGEDQAMASGAIDQLSRMQLPASIEALSTLAKTLPPEQAELARRGARKLLMRGVTEPQNSAHDYHWRTFLSPVDGHGAQFVWFTGQPKGNRDAIIFSVLTHDPVGIAASFSTRDAIDLALPAQTELGRIYVISTGEDGPALILLAVPFAEAQQAVRVALHRNWESGFPTPSTYRLLNPLIWGADFSESEESEASGIPEPMAETRPANERSLDRLLDHPFFESWRHAAAEQIRAWMFSEIRDNLASTDRETTISLLVERIFDPDTSASYQRRLTAMGRWLEQASDRKNARLAGLAAEQLSLHGAEEAPFARQLIGRGLDILQAEAANRPASEEAPLDESADTV